MTDDLNSALQLIASRLGINIADLTDRIAAPETAPTFSEYIAKLRTALPRTTTRNYSSYWRIIENAWGDRTLDEPTATEATDLIQRHRSRASRAPIPAVGAAQRQTWCPRYGASTVMPNSMV
ncbi:hypothetical protein ACIBG0_36115 [Nocardia sp. NPDC050630]|uniref:hypothetical protein n=1 Tax=Nocardia sp. NPDC050630 TaxID=3364321 RepID=UPI00378A130F